MQYLLLMYVDRGLTPPPDTPSRYAALHEATAAAGVHLTTGRLEPRGDESAVVRREGATTCVTEGPIASSAYAPVGFYLLDCADREEAVAWAARMPTAEYGSVEVRPLRPDQSDQT